MGKGKRGKKGGPASGVRQNWQDVPRTNAKLENYYNAQGFIPEEDKEAFWEAMRRDLPNSFRFTGSRGHALAVQKKLQNHFIPEITSITYEGNPVEPPRPVPWYPDQLAWWMTTPKHVVRRFAPFASFQKFLVAETDVGNISRQEVVSMIPPLLIDVRPGMTVLDMCAAPGSKSAQLMELLHAGEEEAMQDVSKQVKEGNAGAEPLGPEGLNDDGRSTGLLIANDADYKRAHMLIHQMKRLSSPNLIVTNHDATMYPSIKLPPLPAAEGKTSQNRYLKFDRILADVPCTGDGTARKNIGVWRDWTPNNAIGLHATQVRILVRALQMLKVGGRVVYSTCSMNPIENEAVISSAIDRCGGSANVKIIDCSNELPGLKRVPGMKSWTVMDREGRIWNNWKEIEEKREQEGISGLGRIAEGMFPPSGENADLPLDRCIRIYPHLQDTGGFFITVLEKTSEIKAKPEDSTKVIPKGTIAALTEELDQKQKNADGQPLEKIEALDDLVTPDQAAAEEASKNATVAESTHQPPYSATSQISPAKRDADSLEDELPSKRTKLEDGTEIVLGDRPVHRPAPATDSDNVEMSEANSTPAPQETADPAKSEPKAQPPQKRKPGQPIEEPYKYLDPAHEEVESIFKFYQVSERFPRDRFMVRNAQAFPSRTIYYTSGLARDILTANEGHGMKITHCGVKMFVKQDAQRQEVCRWRIQTDGLRILEPTLGPDRAVTLHQKTTMRKLLVEMFPKVDDNGWKDLGEIGERVRDISMGCSILYIEPDGSEDVWTERMVLPLWRSLHSVNLMLPKEDRRAMLLRLFNEDPPLINITQKRATAQKATPETPAAVTASEQETPATAPAEAEEAAIQQENVALGQDEQEQAEVRETYTKAGDEEDRFNTTV
ncbi:S-adenosyl-L-methionine-dependent methyltransferase [Aspergillus steynii IBT 23096]|uniref:S-adenosyl-L-methionine-dependent methyltransferase n=1 Tax=Aspergillus steynii IBT 23096 TaxID=1392250 RepID=A0A2I2G667_9EURO|nr:S-adenosyl-L-methionine-dependent methyltransferase [Aspergillus steynii IBT 23096]PLB48375.1 S-adenosyl-L-methionine-dependent methyltransferase [Aspergillus steynii IBT 23096]